MDEDAALEEAAKALEQWVTSPAADSDVSVPETPKYTPRRYVSPRPQPIAEVPAAAVPPASYAPAAVATPPLRLAAVGGSARVRGTFDRIRVWEYDAPPGPSNSVMDALAKVDALTALHALED